MLVEHLRPFSSQIVMARPVPEERWDQTLRFVVRNNDDIDRILPEVGAMAEDQVSSWPPTP